MASVRRLVADQTDGAYRESEAEDEIRERLNPGPRALNWAGRVGWF